jgi:hypothetical protein
VNIPWTTGELKILRDNARLGAREVACLLGRTPRSVEQAAHRNRISLRRPGCRSGTVLGQPRGVSLAAGMRSDLVDGRVSAELLASRMAIDDELPLCPVCGCRPARVPSTGFCRPCHLKRLAEVHREALSEIEAQQDLWAARQHLKRARRQAVSSFGGDLDEREPGERAAVT